MQLKPICPPIHLSSQSVSWQPPIYCSIHCPTQLASQPSNKPSSSQRSYQPANQPAIHPSASCLTLTHRVFRRQRWFPVVSIGQSGFYDSINHSLRLRLAGCRTCFYVVHKEKLCINSASWYSQTGDGGILGSRLCFCTEYKQSRICL